MSETHSGARPSTMQLILVPSLITLAVTILRLVGELQHWPKPWFSASAGGGGAIIGISWLPLALGPYFAMKLVGTGEEPKSAAKALLFVTVGAMLIGLGGIRAGQNMLMGLLDFLTAAAGALLLVSGPYFWFKLTGMNKGPSSTGKSIGFAILGLVVMIVGGIIGFAPKPEFPGKMIVGLLIMAGAAALQFNVWPALGRTLLAYAYAARIPVAIVMYFAIQGNWGTHYDALPPNYTGPADLWGKYAVIGLVPQMVLWPVFTVVIGSLYGSVAAAIVRRGKPAMQTASKQLLVEI